MNRVIFFLLSSVALGLSCISNAQTLYYVMDPKGDLSKQLQPIVRDMIVQTVNSQSDSRATDSLENATSTLELLVDKLDTKYMLSMQKCSANNGSNASCANAITKKVSSLDDIDSAVRNLTLSALSNDSSSVAAEFDDSNAARRYLKIGLGGSILSRLGADQAINYSILLGWSALINQRVGVNIDSMLLFDGNSNTMFTIGLGPQYSFPGFSDLDISPYVKTTVSYYIASNKNDTSGGISLGGGAGATFFKKSDVNMFVESGYVFGTRLLDGKMPGAAYFVLGVAF